MEMHGLGDVFDPGRVVGEPRQRGHRNAKSRFQACADGQVVDGLARSDGKPEAGLAARDERDARVRPADADVDGPRDGGNCRVHHAVSVTLACPATV